LQKILLTTKECLNGNFSKPSCMFCAYGLGILVTYVFFYFTLTGIYLSILINCDVALFEKIIIVEVCLFKSFRRQFFK